VSTRARGEMSRVCRGLDSCPRTQNRLRKRVISHSIVRKLSSRDGKLSQVTGLFFETWLSRGGSGLWTFFGVICKPSPCAGSASKNLRCHPLRTTCVSARIVHNVCVCDVAGFRSCGLSPVTKTCWFKGT